jgi:hypothetical protein
MGSGRLMSGLYIKTKKYNTLNSGNHILVASVIVAQKDQQLKNRLSFCDHGLFYSNKRIYV